MENSDLPIEFIDESLEALKEVKQGKATPYKFDNATKKKTKCKNIEEKDSPSRVEVIDRRILPGEILEPHGEYMKWETNGNTTLGVNKPQDEEKATNGDSRKVFQLDGLKVTVEFQDKNNTLKVFVDSSNKKETKK